MNSGFTANRGNEIADPPEDNLECVLPTTWILICLLSECLLISEKILLRPSALEGNLYAMLSSFCAFFPRT